jgi:hypothetical protein
MKEINSLCGPSKQKKNLAVFYECLSIESIMDKKIEIKKTKFS